MKGEKFEVATDAFETLKELNAGHKEFIKGFMAGVLYEQEKKLKMNKENIDRKDITKN